MAIDYSLGLLEGEYNEIVKIVYTDEWKFYKFGQGGPYKRVLTKLTHMGNEHDPIIFKSFGSHEETASFSKLIVICLKNETPQELYKRLDTFRRQLIRMKTQL